MNNEQAIRTADIKIHFWVIGGQVEGVTLHKSLQLFGLNLLFKMGIWNKWSLGHFLFYIWLLSLNALLIRMLLVASNRKPSSSCLNVSQRKPSVEWTVGGFESEKDIFPFTLLSMVPASCKVGTLSGFPNAFNGSCQWPGFLFRFQQKEKLISWSCLRWMKERLSRSSLQTCPQILLAQAGFCAHLWCWPGDRAILTWENS